MFSIIEVIFIHYILTISFDFLISRRIIIRDLIDPSSEELTRRLTKEIQIGVGPFSVFSSDLSAT